MNWKENKENNLEIWNKWESKWRTEDLGFSLANLITGSSLLYSIKYYHMCASLTMFSCFDINLSFAFSFFFLLFSAIHFLEPSFSERKLLCFIFFISILTLFYSIMYCKTMLVGKLVGVVKYLKNILCVYIWVINRNGNFKDFAAIG